VLPSLPSYAMPSPRKSLLVLSLVGIVVAVPALAQQPSSYPAACDSAKVSKGDVDRAHTVFLSGKGFLDEANYDKAISYFKDAYSIDCSVHGILPIIATAYERKGDKAEAIKALEEYVKRAPTASDHEIIERRMKNLRDQLAQEHPTATATAPTATSSGGTGTAPTGPTATVEPTATSTSTAPTSTTTGGAPPFDHSVVPWVVVGVGAAAAITGVVVFALGAKDVSDAEQKCPTHETCTDPAARDTGNTGRTLETAGIVVGAVGIAAAAGGLVWHFMEGPPSSSSGSLRVRNGNGAGAPSEEGPRANASLRAKALLPHPVLAPGYAGLSVGASF
jgi:hypothetical protein